MTLFGSLPKPLDCDQSLVDIELAESKKEQVTKHERRAARSKRPPPHGSARARLLHLLRARLVALGGSALPG